MFIRRIGRALFRSSPKVGTMTFAEKCSRLAARLRDREWRQYGMLLLAGKALGIAALFIIIVAGMALMRTVSGTPVFAQRRPIPTRRSWPAI